jgi:error-prone DNA polymerase
MTERGYSLEFAEQIFRQIQGFGEYGFPESHSASFALLVYVSCWIKHHEPAAFLCAMLNSQPLGFYAPSQLIQDAQRHDIVVRPIDVLSSHWECTLEEFPEGVERQPAVRLGLNCVKGLSQQAACRIVAVRTVDTLVDAQDLAQRADLNAHDLQCLAAADALEPLVGHRRRARWAVAGLGRDHSMLRAAPIQETLPELVPAPEGQAIVDDYASMGLTLRRHPLALLRPRLTAMRLSTAVELRELPNGRLARTTGIVTVRQRPGTAKGVVFVTIEDETGTTNVIVWHDLGRRQRRELLGSMLLTVYGVWQREGEVCHIVAKRLVDHSSLLGQLTVSSRDFH